MYCIHGLCVEIPVCLIVQPLNGWTGLDKLNLFSFQNEYEQLNYAKQLKERLEAFTRDFLPHMKEEEEVRSSQIVR